MAIKLGVVMDPIQTIHFKKDSTLAMLLEAQARGYQIHYFEPQDLFLRDGVAFGDTRLLTVANHPSAWFTFGEDKRVALSELDVILMRKDPPFNEEYIYITYILEHAERAGVLVVNRPQSLRDCNEKLFATFFPQCTPPTLVSQSIQQLRAFWREQRDIVCKPLNVMGGTSVFRLQENEVNANVIFEIVTKGGTQQVMVQRFIPEISQGDKRILLIDGKPLPYALARVPQGDEWRGNLAVGAIGEVRPLTERDQFICAQVGPALKERGLYFVGIDVIGDYLTEINVTSPTGIREIDKASKINISALLMDVIEKALQ